MITTKLNVKTLATDLQKVQRIAAATDDMDCLRIANLFIELCNEIAKGMIVDEFTMSLVDEHRDSLDRAKRHSISGHMNDPSEMQEIAFRREHKDDN
jgi:hypothetical protein